MTAHEEAGWREYVWRVLDAILWPPSQDDIPSNGSHSEDAISPLASEMLNGGAHLVLSEVRKQQLDGISSSCLAAPL